VIQEKNMIIRCTNCDAAYSVEDQKVENKRFAFTCPKCQAHNVIDNRETGGGLTEQPDLERPLKEEQPSPPEFDTDEGMLGELSDEIPSFEEEDVISGGEAEVEAGVDLSGIEESLDESGDETAREHGVVKAADFDLDDVTIYETSKEVDVAMSGTDLDEPISEYVAQPDVVDEDEDLDLDNIMDSEDESAEDVSLDDALDHIDVSALRETEGDLTRDVDAGEAGGVELDTDEFEEFVPLEGDILTEDFESIGSPRGEGVSVRGEKAVGVDYLEPGDELQMDEMEAEEILSTSSEDLDESITIDLDSLDIQLGEEEVKEGVSEPEVQEVAEMSDFELAEITRDELPPLGEEDDESITIDLDSLDIPLEEEEELRAGEVVDDDERLTLEDAGLTIDELVPAKTAHVKVEEHEEGLEDDIRLSIDEIDPELSVDKLIEEVEEAETLLSEGISTDELPEVDIDRYTEEEGEIREPIPVMRRAETEDFLDIERGDELARYRGRIDKEERAPSDLVPQGLINFSIDYSLKFSRLGAVLRLLGIYSIRLIPHFVVAFIYCALSMIVGSLNWIVILFTGESVDDFAEIQEKTIRGLLSLSACLFDVVEEVPRYAGGRDIDYSLQMDVTYPINYSRILAFLRLSVVGIFILALPHIVLLMLLSVGSILICLVGLISVIATRRWPNILFDFMIRYYRYTTNVISYISGVIDKYPTFRFE
jgi:hypothetical protein